MALASAMSAQSTTPSPTMVMPNKCHAIHGPTRTYSCCRECSVPEEYGYAHTDLPEVIDLAKHLVDVLSLPLHQPLVRQQSRLQPNLLLFGICTVSPGHGCANLYIEIHGHQIQVSPNKTEERNAKKKIIIKKKKCQFADCRRARDDSRATVQSKQKQICETQARQG